MATKHIKRCSKLLAIQERKTISDDVHYTHIVMFQKNQTMLKLKVCEVLHEKLYYFSEQIYSFMFMETAIDINGHSLPV